MSHARSDQNTGASSLISNYKIEKADVKIFQGRCSTAHECVMILVRGHIIADGTNQFCNFGPGRVLARAGLSGIHVRVYESAGPRFCHI